jgi:autotransporter-associated beta strand protein
MSAAPSRGLIFNVTKGGAGTLTLAGSITDAGLLTVSGGVVDLTGSYTRTVYGNNIGLSVSNGATLNVTGQLGTAEVPTGQTAFAGNSITNFSGTAFMSGTSATFRVGEGTSATVNVTGGTLTIGTSSGGVALGRNHANASGFLNISGGSMIVGSSSNSIRIGAGYSNTETSGASVLTISGTGLFDTLVSTGTILLGSNLAGNTASTGTINLNGGTLATNRTITGGSFGASIFNFNGGTFKTNGTTATLATSLTTVQVRDGGAVIDSNGFNIAIAKTIIHSTISGDNALDGGLIKQGTGTLTLSGTEANSYTGLTLIKAGELALSKTAGLNAIAGGITIGDGTTSALLRLINADQIADSSVISLIGTAANAGVFRLNGKAETIGGLSSTGGAGVVENESATSATLTLNNTGTQTFSGLLRNGTQAGVLSLTKDGLGTQILSGASTYTGSTTLNAGTLKFGINNALNATTAVTLTGAGGSATLDLNGFNWTAGAITFYNTNSTATSQATINIGNGGLLTLGSTTFTLNNHNNPLGAQITGGTLDLGAATRTFTIADSSNAAVDLSISSAITSTAGAFGITKAGAGTLRLTGPVNIGGSVSVSNGVLEISGSVSTGAGTTTVGSVATPGLLRLLTGTNYSTFTIAVGQTTNFQGSLVVRGGALATTTPNASAGIAVGSGGYGGIFLQSGSITTNRVDTVEGTTVASAAVLQVSGGTLTNSEYIMFRNQRWEFTVTGGEVQRQTSGQIALGFRGSATAQGVMTVAGGLVNSAGLLITLGAQNDNRALSTVSLNLSAGTLITHSIVHYKAAESSTTGLINFNGGTLQASVNSTNLISTSGSSGNGSLAAYVNGAFGSYNGGAVINTSTFNVTLPIALLTPTGNGVSSILVTAGGSGYVGAPYVEISGGGGTGATATALVDLDPASVTYGQLLGITVTNPGNGYTSAPTITLLGGGGTGATIGTVTTVANTSGGLTKSGTGTLTLSGAEANTFTGMSYVNTGELALSKNAGINAIAGDITIGDGSTSALLRLINADQLGDTSVITLNGTGANAGIFRLNGRSETLGGLSSTGGAGFVENESATSATLTLNNSSTQTFSGVLRNGTLAGTLSLVKNGAGTQILSGANTYTGTTTINAGTLRFGADNVIQSTSNLIIAAAGASPATFDLNGRAWTAGAITFYNATSTATSQSNINIGTGGLLTLGSTVFTLNNDNNPLGAQITGGTLDLGAATRTFTIADSSNAVADLTITSAITSTAGAYGLLKAGAGTLRLTGAVNLSNAVIVNQGVLEVGGTFTNNSSGTSVGSTTPGMLRLTSGANYSTTTIALGNSTNLTGSLVIRGGDMTLTTTSISSGVTLGKAGYGGLFLSSGSLSTRRVDSDDGTTASSVAILQVSGGTLNTANYIMFRNQRWEFTVTDGQVLRTGDYISLAYRGSATAQGVMTVAGGLVNNAGQFVTFGQQNNSTALATGTLNLNVGSLITNRVLHYKSADAATTAYLNFNGGTLQAAANDSTFISTSGSAGTGSMTAYVNGAFGAFAGGAVINTSTFNVTIPIALLTPTGNGVSSIPVTAGGSGYVGAPYVEISGGGGTGATATALVDLDPASASYGQLLGITVTNPGNGYTSTPTITLLGGGGTGATIGTVTTAANTSGGLTKSGTGSLTLSGTTANTFTGMSYVHAGELALSKTAGLNAIAGNITIGDGTTSAVVRLINADQIADTSVITFTGSGGIFRLNNRNETIGGLSSTGGAGIVENESGSAATSTLTVNVASGTHTFSGSLRNGDGTGTDGTLALTKTGAGTQVLSGANTYSGATSINEGTLQISTGSTTGTGAVSVTSGSTILGTGTIKGSSFTASSGATIHAGDGIAQENYGTLTFMPVSGSGAFDFQSGSNIVLGIHPGGVSDRLDFVGTGTNTLFLNGNLTVSHASFTPTTATVFNLLDWSGLSAAPTFASRYTFSSILFGNGDEATGLDLPDIFGTGYGWDISSFITNGSIALVVVPEPSRLCLLGFFLVLLALRRVRKIRVLS